MKKILSLLLLIAGAVTTRAQSKVAKIQVKTTVYCDHCKTCNSCGKRLEDAVYNEKGIKRVDIDDKANTVSIVYNPAKTSPEKLRLAIAKAGFDADDVKGDVAAYDKWDDCCKKPAE